MYVDNAKLKQYLLETLSDSETEALDLRVISDESFVEELSLAEHDLIEDHLEGMLSAEESARFASNFLTSPERHALLRDISMLKDFARKKAGTTARVEAPAKSPTFFGNFFSFYFRPLAAGAAVLLVVIALAVVWSISLPERVSPVEIEIAELNKRDLGDIAELTKYSSINLSSGNFRGSGSVSKQSAGKFTETVLLRLALPAIYSDDAKFKAKVRGTGANYFAIDDIRAYRNPNGRELRVLVPKAVLQNGQYQIDVGSKADSAPVATYVFIVE